MEHTKKRKNPPTVVCMYIYTHIHSIYTYTVSIHMITPYYSQFWSNFYDHNNNTSKSSYIRGEVKQRLLFLGKKNMDQYCARDMDLRKLSFTYQFHFGLFWAITFEHVFLSKGPLPNWGLAENTTFSGHVGEIIAVKFTGQYPPHTWTGCFTLGRFLPPGCNHGKNESDQLQIRGAWTHPW